MGPSPEVPQPLNPEVPARPPAPVRAPPRWPWITLIVAGALAVGAAAAGVSLVVAGQAPLDAVTAYGIMAVVGGVLLLIGLVGLAIVAIRVKRWLPPERYRGPSIFVILLIVLVAGNLASGVFLLDDLGALATGGELPALSGSVLLLLTPLAFVAASALFILLPDALAGFRLTDGRRTLANIVAGVLLGIAAWGLVAVLSLGVEWVARQTGQSVEGQQMVADLLANVPPIVAVLAAGLIVPFGEELFFRGMVMSAWEREYGPRRALVGSAVLFTAIHVPDGGVLIVAPILALALVLGIAYQRTRSLPLVVALHGSFNAISTLLLILQAG